MIGSHRCAPHLGWCLASDRRWRWVDSCFFPLDWVEIERSGVWRGRVPGSFRRRSHPSDGVWPIWARMEPRSAILGGGPCGRSVWGRRAALDRQLSPTRGTLRARVGHKRRAAEQITQPREVAVARGRKAPPRPHDHARSRPAAPRVLAGARSGTRSGPGLIANGMTGRRQSSSATNPTRKPGKCGRCLTAGVTACHTANAPHNPQRPAQHPTPRTTQRSTTNAPHHHHPTPPRAAERKAQTSRTANRRSPPTDSARRPSSNARRSSPTSSERQPCNVRTVGSASLRREAPTICSSSAREAISS